MQSVRACALTLVLSARVCAFGVVLHFDLEVDAEEEIEYAPRKIVLPGVDYPAWMTDGLFMQPEMAPRLLKLMLANVYHKEE